jgi:hypothetical protein
MQGEHNAEILAELGYGEKAVSDMEASGALVGNFASMMIASVMGQVSAQTEESDHDA